MSKEIDEKVVEMRFDNEHFEKNVQTSMSTLDKFKQKLQFKDAGKGFNDIEKAAKKTDLSPLAKSADKVGLRFNAMYTMADQAFRNITNSAMAAGKRIVNALTIDPVKTGLQEYETKMNAIQVIQANTRGKDMMEDITAALEELNEYADKTIYNFAQMTSNVGKFTAQGYRAKEAANAVKGLANLAAASGASAEDMARATYQMSQALGGTIRMIDWNSLRNANMATVDLKNTLMDLARVNGIAIDDMIAKHGTFEQTLQEGWLSGSMFTEAMNIYSGIYSEADLKAKGFTDAQIANFMDLAKMAESAATEVKTFTQLFDVLKETAQSGWTQTWEIIFGDFDTAKSMFTDLQVYFSDIINGFSEARNMLLGGALNLKNPWSKIQEKLEASSFGKVLQTFDKVKNTVEDASKTVEHFQKVVNDVWRGDYKNSDTGRFELLEAAGYNSKVIQDLVNKGYGYKLTVEDIEESHKKFGVTIDGTTSAIANAENATEGLTVKYNELTDAQLEQAGLTKEEIKLFMALADEADRTGVTMRYLVDEMSKNDGRTMLIESAKNAWEGLVSILLAVRDAWVDIFPPMTVVQLYSIIKGIREFSEYLIVHEETQEKLTRTLRGVFAILDVILTLVSLPMKIAFKALTSLLSVLDIDILSVTANIGDAVVAFRDWIDSALDFTKMWEKVIPLVKDAIKWFKNLGSGLQNGFSEAGDNAVLGLIKGLLNGVRAAGKVIAELGKTLINKFCEILGIHSPSLVFMAIGGFIVAGLLLGIKTFFPEVWSTISSYALKCADIIQDIDWGSVFSAITSAATTIALLRISSAVKNFSSMFEGLGDMLSDVGKGVKKALKGLGSALKGIGASFRAKALKDIAIAIVILAGALVALSFVPPERLKAATIAIATLGGVLGGLLLILNATSKIKFDKEMLIKFGVMTAVLVGIATAMLILAKSLSLLSDLSIEDNWVSILGGLAAIVVAIGLIMAEIAITTKFIKAVDFAKFAVAITAISGLMLVMAIAMNIFAGMEPSEFGKAITFVTAFGVIVAALAALSNRTANMKTAQIGSLIKNVGVAMLLMAITCKIIASMSWGAMGKAAIGLRAFSRIVVALMIATKLATDKDIAKAGKVISAVGTAMLLMALTGKIINTMTWSDMGKAFVGIAGLAAIITGLLAATRLATDKELVRVGSTILMLSISIGILAFIASLLSLMDTKALVKGVTAVSALGLMMTAMIYATSRARKCMGNLIVMTVAIALMTSSVALLSMIDTDKLLSASGAMVAMMGMFAAMIASTKLMDKKALIPLIAMTVIVAALGAVVWGLSELVEEPREALIAVGALSLLMTAMTALLIILSKSFKMVNIMDVTLGLVGLAAMIIPLSLFGYALTKIPDLTGQEKSILIVVGVMAAMSVLLLITAAVGAIYMATIGVAATGLLGLVAMALMLEVFGNSLFKIPDLSGSIDTINTVTDAMTRMGDLLFKISIVGPLALIGVTAIAGMIGVMTSFGVIAGLIGKLVDTCPSIEEFVGKGIGLFEQLAEGLGSVISHFISGMMSEFPTIGTQLSEFMANAQGFIDGIKLVDGDVLKGIGILVGVFTALTATEMASSISSFVKGLFGEDQFESFGNGLISLSECVKTFSDSMGDFTEEDLDGVKWGAKALSVMAKAAKSIPNSGGVSGFFAGNNNIDDFIKMVVGTSSDGSDGIAALIKCISGIEIDKTTVTRVEHIRDIIEELSKAAETSSKKDAGTRLVYLGNGMTTFSEKFKTFIAYIAAIETVAFTDATTNLNTFIGLIESISTDTTTNISNFGNALKDVANGGIKSFNKAFPSSKSIDDAKKAINSFIASVAKKVKTKKNKGKFEAVGKYLAQGLADCITNNKSIVTTAAKNVAKAAYEAAAKELGIESPSKKFKEVGKYVDEGFAKGITDNEDVVGNAMTDLTDKLLADTERELDINSPSLVYNEVGRLIVEGLAEGIDETDTAEVAMRKKLGNIYSAWYDWNKNNPNDQKTFAQAFAASGLRITQTMQDQAKELGYKTTFDYLEDTGKQALADAYDGLEQDLDEAADNAEKLHRKTIEKLENSIDSSKLKVKTKTSKLNILASAEEKVQTEIKELEYQNGQRQEQINELEAIIDEYSKRTNVVDTEDTTDANIIRWRKEINSIYEDIADADIRIDELRQKSEEDANAESIEAAKINPPSLEYNKKLGHHIVKNIAYGIEEEDSAEEAAKKKAQNISDAFQTAFDDISREQERRDLEYEKWELTNPDAKQSTKDAKLLNHLKDELATLKTAEEYAHSEYLETKRILGESSKEAKTAYNDWLKAQNERAFKEQEIRNTRKGQSDRAEQEQKEYTERRKAALDERREIDYELWVTENQNATEETKRSEKLKYLEEKRNSAQEAFNESKKEYLKLLKKNNNVYTPEVLEARNIARQDKKILAEIENEIAAEDKDYLIRKEEALDELIESEYSLWLEENQNASEEVKRAKKLEYLNKQLVEATEDTLESRKEYERLLSEYNDKEAPEVIAALNKFNENSKTQANIQNQINDVQEETVDAAKEQKDIAYRMAKLKYDIWEKTAGRDADDAVKEAKQLEYLSEQASIQTYRLKTAAEDYNKAVANYGMGSNEAFRAYENMLNESYNLAELKSQILDLEESSADRQKRLRDKQDLSRKEYDDYIKKYEKYYLANGMTKADLERDAKLVSGYDPSKIVNNITKQTKKALETVTTSVNYQNILTGFSDMGTTYVNAINEGIASQTDTIESTTTKMIEKCVAGLIKKRPLWVETGKYLIEGLVVGFSEKRGYAIDSVTKLSSDMIKAAKATLYEHSPSRAFAEIGRYAVLGLVKGLVDNSRLSSDAASRLGDSAIENLKKSIIQISEVVNADLDTQPTIRPVLDLSNVRSGTARLNAMVSNAQAIAISTSRKSREVAESNQNGNSDTASSGNTYQFTQNNYSPKALSPAEIYRQTRNQFAAMKGALNK